jgi:hypothetical protein
VYSGKVIEDAYCLCFIEAESQLRWEVSACVKNIPARGGGAEWIGFGALIAAPICSFVIQQAGMTASRVSQWIRLGSDGRQAERNERRKGRMKRRIDDETGLG